MYKCMALFFQKHYFLLWEALSVVNQLYSVICRHVLFKRVLFEYYLGIVTSGGESDMK